MSAAARGAAGYLYASGRLRPSRLQKAKNRAERAADGLKREREAMVTYRKRKALEPIET